MSVASYLETPGSRGIENKFNQIEDTNNNGTNLDELSYKIAKIQDKLSKEPTNNKLQEQFQTLTKLRNAEIKRLAGKEDISKLIAEGINQYKEELRQKGLVDQFNNDKFKKAELLVNYVNNNPSAKNLGVKLRIEDGKVVLSYNGKEKFFTIPTMNKDGTINHQENLARLNFYYKDGFNDFVKKYVPEIKSFAEIGQENINNTQREEKIA